VAAWLLMLTSALIGLLAPSAPRAARFAEPFDFIGDPERARLPRGVHLRAAFLLDRTGTLDSFPASELSALAWNADAGVLHAVSDRGFLLTLHPLFDGERLVGITRGVGAWLTAADGGPLTRPVDAEGLVLRDGDHGVIGDETLVVSFESPAHVALHGLDGRRLESLPLPAPLDDLGAYASRNDALEAIADSRYGLVASPQRPLAGTDPDRIHLYALADGTHWWMDPIDARFSSLSDMVRAGDQLLALERVYGGPFRPFIAALHRLTLPPGGGAVESCELLRFDSTEGFRMDNFEGIALHHDGRHVFLVSDDNQSAWQKTLLLYVELPVGCPAG
jgi:hypothetical protein